VKRLSVVLVVAVILALGAFAVVRAQAPRTYTCLWNHDGVGTDTYQILVDGTVSVTVPNDVAHCPAVTPRVCSSPLTMTTNVAHVVIIKAVNTFGEASSDPFAASPPANRPAAVIVR
jgi:hypothetical protein